MRDVTRKYRSGGLHQRSSDGRWIGSIPDGHGGVLKYVTGTNKELVERKMREVAKSTTSRRVAKASSERLDAFMERWLATRTLLAPRTVASYQSRMTHHILPALGALRLRDIEALDVQELVNATARTHSSQTAKHCRNILSAALGQAVKWGLIEANVAKLADAPRVKRRLPTPLRTEQVLDFLEATKADPRHAFYVLAFTTGMRRGEMLGLKWPDIDLESGTVNVHGTLRQLSRYRFIVDPPKTDRSNRVLGLSEQAVDALRAYRQQHATSTGYVFAREDGRPWAPAEVTRVFQARLTEAGLPHARLHDARHTAAAMMLDENGGDMVEVMRYLGHSSIQTTVDIYGGMGGDSRQRVAVGMTRTLRRRNG